MLTFTRTLRVGEITTRALFVSIGSAEEGLEASAKGAFDTSKSVPHEDAADGFGFGEVVTLPSQTQTTQIFLKKTKKKEKKRTPRRVEEGGGGRGGANPNPKLVTSLGGGG